MKTALDHTLDRIFAACPELCGFAVDDAQELGFIDVALNPGYEHSEPLLGALADALLELIEDEPEARELLRGRTFARTLH